MGFFLERDRTDGIGVEDLWLLHKSVTGGLMVVGEAGTSSSEKKASNQHKHNSKVDVYKKSITSGLYVAPLNHPNHMCQTNPPAEVVSLAGIACATASKHDM